MVSAMLKRFMGNSFLVSNTILMGGAMLAGTLNYLFYPVAGRLLPPAAFGEVQAVISLFLQLSTFLMALSIITVFIVANYKGANRRNMVLFELEKIALLAIGSVVVLGLVFSGWLTSFFNFDSGWPVLLLGAMLIFTVPLTFRSAYLRGRNDFLSSTVANVFSAAGRFVFSVPLVLLGFGAAGALAGVALSQLAALAFASWKSLGAGLRRPPDFKTFGRPPIKSLWPEIKYSLIVLVCSLAVMAQLTIDNLAVKHYFDDHTAGLYAGVATVSRIIFFLTASVSQTLLPSIKIGTPVRNKKLLKKSLGLFLAISLPALAVFILAPKIAVGVLMGSDYADQASLLPLLGVTIFTIALCNLLITYFLALKRYMPGVFAIIGFAASFVLMFIHHSSLQAVVESLFAGSMVSTCLIAIWLARQSLVRRKFDETTATIHRGSSAQRVRQHSDLISRTGRHY